MSIIGIVNLVIFVLLIVKCGFGKGIGFLLGMWFLPAICGVFAAIAAGIAFKSLATAKLVGIVVEIVVVLMRLKKATNDLRN